MDPIEERREDAFLDEEDDELRVRDDRCRIELSEDKRDGAMEGRWGGGGGAQEVENVHCMGAVASSVASASCTGIA